MIAKSSATMGGLALAALAALALAGCGKQGELERPRPLVGHGVRPNAETRTRQDAAARARRDAKGDAQAPQSTDEVRNRDAQLPPPPLKGTQLPGMPAGPNPQKPEGGLPNPLQPATVPQ